MGELKNAMYYLKRKSILEKAYKKGFIKPFDEDLYKRLNKFYAAGLPLDLYLKYYQPTDAEYGDCYARSLYLLAGFENAMLVRGSRKDMEMKYGKDNGGHGWVEYKDWVYDPTSLMMYNKDLYYKVFGVNKVSYHSKEKYENNSIYQDIINSSIDDYKKDGKKRTDLIMVIPFMQKNIELRDNSEELKEELDKYLKEIGYDYGCIVDTLVAGMENMYFKR